jgi:phosphate-selective porin OprO and OprP
LSYVDLTERDIQGGIGQNVSAALNWWWTSHSRMQFNITYGDIRNRAPAEGFTGGHFVGLGTGLMIEY